MPPPPPRDLASATRGWRIGTAAIVAFSLAIRLAWLLLPHDLQPDSIEYITLATSLLTTGRFSMDGQTMSTYRPPLYPLLLATAQSATGEWQSAVLLVQCALGALTVYLAMKVSRRYFGERVALIAGVLLAAAPMTGRFAALLLTETVFTFLMLVAVESWAAGRPVVAGIASGAAALTRASLLPYMLLIGAAGLIFSWPKRRACLRRVAGALVVIAPWVARNAYETGRWTVADAGWGVNFLVGTVDLRSGSNRWRQIEAAIGADAGHGSAQREAAAVWQALEIIRAHPGRWLRVRARQWMGLFLDSGDYLPVSSNRITFGAALNRKRLDTLLLKAGFMLGTAAWFALAVCGAWIVRRRALELLPIWSFPVYLAVAHLPMAIEPRYGLPLVPFLTIFAAVAIAAIVARVQGRSASQPAASAAGTATGVASAPA